MVLDKTLIAVVSMGGLGIFFSICLSIANKKLQVQEDPRINQIMDILPGANCGACGYAGCSNFAENIVNGKALIESCPVCSIENKKEIATIMGIESKIEEPKIARVMCQGGIAETAKKADYVGIRSCIAASIVSGGEKLCSYGCIGYGDCVNSCPFDAMYMNDNGLPVVIDEKCTGCGKCVEACPRDIIELHPKSHKLFILCKNKDNPKDARKVCTKACIGCGICVRASKQNQITLVDNLAQINYETNGKNGKLPTDKCPTGCMVEI